MASPFPGMNPYLEIRYFGQKVIDYTQEPVPHFHKRMLPGWMKF